MKKTLSAVAATVLLAACTNGHRLPMVVGTYTDSGSFGLYSFAFDEDSGRFELLDSCRADNPSYLTFSDDGRFIYAVNEGCGDRAAAEAFAFDRRSGAIESLGARPANGDDPCYISTNGKIVVTADYTGGLLTLFPLSADGRIEPLSTQFAGDAGGPDSIRQSTPHIHCAEFSNDGKYLYATDFSADRILCFEVSGDGTKLTFRTAVDVEPDYGPRHIVFDREGLHAYVIGELSGLITVFDVDDGQLTVRQVIDADPCDGRGSADIHLSPDGRHLYASNRLAGDGIAVFSVDPSNGELTDAGYAFTGPHPRNFAITPNGKYLLCACRDSNAIEIWQRDSASGLLTPTGEAIALKKPVCIRFLR